MPDSSPRKPGELVGVFGGTFDPIHNGHLETVRAVREVCGLERILFIPAATPPHRDAPGATPQQRMEMVALAIADDRRFILDDREFRRPPPSYTYHTLSSLAEDMPGSVCCFILGIDALLNIDSWYRWQDVLEMANFIAMGRPGFSPPSPLPQWWQQRSIASARELGNKTGGQILEVNIAPRADSATQIRQGIANGEDVSAMIPKPVWQYIRTHNLYR